MKTFSVKMRIPAAVVALMLPALAVAQNPQTSKTAKPDYIESSTFNKDYRGAKRSMHYRPTADGFIECINGNNTYTRALYGGHSLWRLETSDRPIFAAYHKSENRNIHFYVTAGAHTVRLDSAAYCRALYQGGTRIYELSDPLWDGGRLTLTALACPDKEGAVWKVVSTHMPADARLTAAACATVKVKINRSGDIGADPANCFAPDPGKRDLKECTVDVGGNAVNYVGYLDRDVTSADQATLAADFDAAEAHRRELTGNLLIDTPDPYFNTLGSSLAAAADRIWDGLT